VVRAVLDLAAATAAGGAEVVVATTDDADAPEGWPRVGPADLAASAPPPGVPRVVRTPPPDRPAARLSRARVEAHAPLLEPGSCLHLHGMWSPRSLQLGALARARGVPYVISPHGMLDDWSMAQKTLKKRVYLALGGRRWLEDAAAVLCTARAELEQARRWFSRARGESLPLIMDLGDYRTLPGPGPARERLPELAGEDPPSLLFLSRLHPKKGLERLIDAVAVLRDGGTDVRLVVAGTGEPEYERGLRRRAADRGVADRTRFVGFVRGSEKVSLLQACELFVLPTSQENFGFVIFEALAAGLPVVTTRGVDTWPEVEESGGGAITEADPPAIARTVAELLADEPRRARMSEAGRGWALRTLATDELVGRYLDLYRSVLEASP
jgi:glycosyltransferase involved in cell wall biosynthesis